VFTDLKVEYFHSYRLFYHDNRTARVMSIFLYNIILLKLS